MIVGDVNGRKIVNDSMGHRWRDEVLRQITQILREVTRPDDLVIRWGGYEFVLLLPCTSRDEAEERCRVIHELTEERSKGSIMLSIALGCAAKTAPDRSIEDRQKLICITTK